MHFNKKNGFFSSYLHSFVDKSFAKNEENMDLMSIHYSLVMEKFVVSFSDSAQNSIVVNISRYTYIVPELQFSVRI